MPTNEPWKGWLKDADTVLNGPCPICGGIEGCWHSREERLRAAIAKSEDAAT